jgi:hypothetical protein
MGVVGKIGALSLLEHIKRGRGARSRQQELGEEREIGDLQTFANLDHVLSQNSDQSGQLRPEKFGFTKSGVVVPEQPAYMVYKRVFVREPVTV